MLNNIETDNFIIRPFRIEDLDDVYSSWGKDREMFKYLTMPFPKSKKEMKEYINTWINDYENKVYEWCFSVLKQEHSIGFIRLKNYIDVSGGIVSIECGLSSDEWNKGYMSECLLAFMRHILLKEGINRVEARCDIDAKSTIRVLEKCGMIKEGISRSSGQNNSKNKYDEVVFSLLRNDL